MLSYFNIGNSSLQIVFRAGANLLSGTYGIEMVTSEFTAGSMKEYVYICIYIHGPYIDNT
jgi:hypothetical protein